MTRYLLLRLATLAATLLAASALVFGALELLPGNAAQVILGETATPEAVAALEQRLGLDRPATTRYAEWLASLARGEGGHSLFYDEPSLDLLAQRAQVTLPLALLAMALTTVLALSAGVWAASRQGRWADLLVMLGSQIGLAVPAFWLAILLIGLFAVKLGWVAAGGFPGWSADEGGGLGPGLAALLLPAVALALVQSAILARVTRSALLEVQREDFVRTARAKGLSPRAVVWRHVLRNALLPVLTVAGLQFADLLTGTIVVENVFVLPGVGRLVFQAVSNRDLVLVRDVVLVLVALVVAVHFVLDLLHAWIDPRWRSGPRAPA
jgi:peptide/nickel transport system permease protein